MKSSAFIRLSSFGIITFILVGIMSVSVAAQEYIWLSIGSSSNKQQIFIDLNSYYQLTPEHTVRSVWVKFVKTNNDYFLQRQIHDCRSNRFTLIVAVNYDRSDNLIDRLDFYGSNWEQIKRRTVAEQISRRVCFSRESYEEAQKDFDKYKPQSITGNSISNSKTNRGTSNDSQNSIRDGQVFVTVITKSANIRTTPSMNGEVVVTASKGFALLLLNRKSEKGWYQVSLGELGTGWIHGNTVEFINTGGEN